MSHHKIGICIPTYNSEKTIDSVLQSILIQDSNLNIHVYIVDDGSTDSTPEILKKYKLNHSNFNIHLDGHNERGITRKKSIDEAINDACDYILFIDSDMSLSKNLISNCLDSMNSKDFSALIIPENPFSSHTNFMTQLKIFERKIVNLSEGLVDQKSIEAARFWRTKAYLASGQINPTQIAFEEIQPTIRILELGGLVGRVKDDFLNHDEGQVALVPLLKKKYYYFSQMNKTLNSETNGSAKAATRWYFFRSYLYTPKSLCQYLRYPHYFIGLISMYICLSFIAVFAVIKSKYAKNY